MGIEPTDHMISIRPNGFEDRDQHQLSKHFRVHYSRRVSLHSNCRPHYPADFTLGNSVQFIGCTLSESDLLLAADLINDSIDAWFES